MRIMKKEAGQPFANLFQLGKEAEGFLPVGWWKACLIGWGEGLPFEIKASPKEAWELLSARFGPLAPYNEDTEQATC